jgi:nitroreductase
VVVVCADLDHIGQSYGSRGRETYSLQDTAAATMNMLLTITDLGLASCWIGAFDEDKAAKLLRLEGGIRPVAMLPIGYSSDDPAPPKRKPLAQVVSYLD